MLKNIIRGLAQKLIGFDRYLYILSRFNIYRLRFPGYEKEFSYFNGMIGEEGVILDIGANIGAMTVALAQKHLQSQIYSFEPVPENFTALKRIVAFYQLNNIRLFETALGDRDGTAQMITPQTGNAYQHGLSHLVKESEASGKEFLVRVQQLDTIPALQQAIKIIAIKIDVENFEHAVLKGGEALLRKHRPLIFCELWNNGQRKFSIDLLASLGYKVMVLKKGRLVDFTGQKALNFFFLP
jgi:FkbM family methyltransferase